MDPMYYRGTSLGILISLKKVKGQYIIVDVVVEFFFVAFPYKLIV